MTARSHQAFRKMKPGSIGGQSRVATPVSPQALLSPITSAPTVAEPAGTPHYAISGYNRTDLHPVETEGTAVLWFDLGTETGASGSPTFDFDVFWPVPQEVAAFSVDDISFGTGPVPAGVANGIGLPPGTTLSNLTFHFDWSPATYGTASFGSVWMQVYLHVWDLDSFNELYDDTPGTYTGPGDGEELGYREIGLGESSVDISIPGPFTTVSADGALLMVSITIPSDRDYEELTSTRLEFDYT